jgi:hypothetical protein
MRAYRLVKAYWVKRQMIKALWKALDYNGDGRRLNPSICQSGYEGPHVALTVLANERKLKEHYRCTDAKSGLGITGCNIHTKVA